MPQLPAVNLLEYFGLSRNSEVRHVASGIVAAAGGAFLVEERQAEEVFTPEDLNQEQRQIAAAAERFARERIEPAIPELERREPGAMERLLRQAAEEGFAAVDIPEEYGGLGLDKVSSTLVTDKIAMLASFSTAFGAHTGIALLPVLWFGTEAQKQRYLPALATCERIGAYGLSEASSGSDAMNVRTRATLEPGDGYRLNGEKQWLTNCGIAGLYTVFAKIVDPATAEEKFSAFLVEPGTPGLKVGAEEHKMGIRGSSTCPLVLTDCLLPATSLLGEAGKGARIAFGVLNVGRFKLGAATVGFARLSVNHMARYARERKAFGKPIAEFGLIQEKIAQAAARLYAAESMVYRTAGMIDARLAAGGTTDNEAYTEYTVECSILKVYGSEMNQFAADELVATMGGYGYVEDFPAERLYRDARINRIFEGTNEINRLIVSGWMLKRALQGKLPLMAAIQRTLDEAMQPPSFELEDENAGPLAHQAKTLKAVKQITLFAAGVASQRFMSKLEEEQEIMGALSAMIIEAYALESALLRSRKLGSKAMAKLAQAMTGLLAERSLEIATQAARLVLSASSEGDEFRTQLAILRRLARVEPANLVELQRQVARAVVEAGRYPLG